MFGFRLGNPRKSLVSITNLNDIYTDTIALMDRVVGLGRVELKRKRSVRKIFVVDFDGDVTASQSKGLTHEVTAIICNAQRGDQVLVRLSSPGGAAHSYGYAASQLARFKKAGIPMVIAVDKIAASGGYLMACVGDRIISSPWAIIGSIGVVAEFPNFFNLLQTLGIEYKQYTAGAFKRTVSSLGPVTQEGENKFKEDLMDVYSYFCKHVSLNRPVLAQNIERVATGEHWNGSDALELGLVDELKTSEEYILENMKDFEFIKVAYAGDRRGFAERLGGNFAQALADGFVKSLYKAFVSLLYIK